MQFDFDPLNFGVGVGAGWLTAFAAYRARHALGRMRESVEEQASSAQEYASRSAEGRYGNELLKFCETEHLFGESVPLSQLAVEPRFIAPDSFAAPPDDDINYDVFRIVPKVHDHPYLHATYNIGTVSIEELSHGDRTIALLGLPGSGRTTALLTIALWGLGRVEFKAPEDEVTKRIEEEEKALKAEERANRIKDRMTIAERARERLALEKGIEEDPGVQNNKTGGLVSPFHRLTPVYVHMANVMPLRSEFGRRADPAEPLVRAIQAQVGRVAAKTTPRRIYERLSQGRVLLLLDGYDDLSTRERRLREDWLENLVREYRRNFIIVTGPAEGFGGLTRAGLTPVFLRPWNDTRIGDTVEKLAEKWPGISGERRATRPDAQLIEQAREDARVLSAFDVTVRARGTLAGEIDDETIPGDWMENYLASVGVTPEMTPHLTTAAVLQLDEGFITLSRMQDVALGNPAPPPPVDFAAVSNLDAVDEDEDVDALFGGGDDDDVDSLFADDEPDADFGSPFEDSDDPFADQDVAAADDDVDATFAEDPGDQPAAAVPVREDGELDNKEIRRISKEQAQLLAAWQKMGLLRRYRGNRYLFRHTLIASYYASFALQDASDAEMAQKAMNPDWEHALAYAAGHTQVDAAVKARIDGTPDVLYNHLLRLTRWLAYSNTTPEWRATLLSRLGNLFVAPNQYSLIRERVAAALAGSRDRNSLVVFQKSLRSPEPDIRRLASLGIGVSQEPKAVAALAPLLADEDANVQLASGLALGAIGTEEAFEEMVIVLTEGSEQLRQAISETFAAIPEEGYPILYDAIYSEDMMLRRAAVFGLRRVPTPWALIAIYRAFLEDEQWYVRSAAQQAFQDMQIGDGENTIRHYPAPESISWLREWVASQGEEAATINPDEALVHALRDGDDVLKSISATAIGQLGLVTNVADLYEALLYRDPTVRDAAHRALADLQIRMGEGLPAPA